MFTVSVQGTTPCATKHTTVYIAQPDPYPGPHREPSTKPAAAAKGWGCVSAVTTSTVSQSKTRRLQNKQRRRQQHYECTRHKSRGELKWVD